MANEVVGTVVCWGRGCNEIASVHETKRGGKNRKGSLYLNCPECRCLQPTGASSQAYIKQNMVPRDGFEYLTENKPSEPEQEPKPEPIEEKEETAERPVKTAPLVFLGVVALGALALVR